nr:dihydrofolate reductase family protein [Glycomyces xiaoerkulensis]
MNRPHVIVSAAMSIDGYLDDDSGRRLILSNAADLDRVDEVRSGVDAIAVGAGTVRADDPRLLVRSAERRALREAAGRPPSPLRVVFSRSGELDPGARLFNSGEPVPIVYTGEAGAERCPLVRRGSGPAAEVVVAGGSSVSLPRALEDLAARGVRRLLVEGGGALHTAFLSADLVDEMHLAVAPFLLGARGGARLAGPASFPQSPERPLELVETRPIGEIAVMVHRRRGETDAATLIHDQAAEGFFMKAIVVEQTGGPNVMRLLEGEDPGPRPGQIAVRVAAAGVNFIDTYHRSGVYPLPLPFTPGLEGGGTVAAVGEGVTEFEPGDEVAWPQVPGSYADTVVGRAEDFVPVPPKVSVESAAAVMLQGMTAHYLCNSVYPVQEGDTVVVHAAAGGVGLLLTQMVKYKGGTVIGTVSTDAKAELARSNGCDHVLFYEGFAAQARELTDGAGAAAVFDGVGKDTFEESLDALRPRGMMALFGQSSGPAGPLDPQALNRKGSLFLTRPTLAHYMATREEYRSRAAEVFQMIEDNNLHVRVSETFRLDEAVEVHQALESRKTTGKVLLIP